MKKLLTYVGAVLMVAVVVAFASPTLAARINSAYQYFENGFAAGQHQELTVSDDGDLTTSGNLITTGNFGISTSTPGNELSVGGSAYIGGNLAATGTAYFIGNTGVGTSTPDAKLSVHARASDTNTQLFKVASSTASATTSLFYVTNTGNTYVAGNVGIGTTTPVVPLNISLTNSAATQLLMSRLGSTQGATAFDFASGDSRMGTLNDFKLFTGISVSGSIAAGTERLVVRATNGNVGVGTSTPSSLFQISSSGTTTASYDNTSATKGACLEIKDSDGVGYSYVTVANGVLTTSAVSCK